MSFSEFRQKAAEAGLHDEGYAGAVDTDNQDDNAIVDKKSEIVDIFEDMKKQPDNLVSKGNNTIGITSTSDNEGSFIDRFQSGGLISSVLTGIPVFIVGIIGMILLIGSE